MKQVQESILIQSAYWGGSFWYLMPSSWVSDIDSLIDNQDDKSLIFFFFQKSHLIILFYLQI